VKLGSYILRRILQMVPLILMVMIVNFGLIKLAPGDVALAMAGSEPAPEFVEAIRVKYGLDRPVSEQFLRYMSLAIRGDLGISVRYQRPVLDLVKERVPTTLLLILPALLIGAFAGTVIGTWQVKHSGTRLDSFTTMLSAASYSIPVFWIGVVLMWVFAVRLHWLPTSGMFNIPRGEGVTLVIGVVSHLILPLVSLSAVWFGGYARLARSSVAEAMEEDYITTARAVGYKDNVILRLFALRNAMLPIVTMFGLEFGLILTGAVLTETVFAWPGLGSLTYEAIMARDTPLVVGIYVVAAICVAAASLATDILYAYLDPTIVYK